MYISDLEIENYKSFRKSDPIQLAPKMNLVIGSNNSGKTAMLEAMSLSFMSKPHRSLSSLPTRGTVLPDVSRVQLKIAVSGEDLKKLLRDWRVIHFDFPLAGHSSIATNTLRRWQDTGTSIQSVYSGGEIVASETSFESYHKGEIPTTFVKISLDDELRVIDEQIVDNVGLVYGFAFRIVNEFRNRIYRFSAQRLNVDKCPIGSSSLLLPDASNLPEVLQVLQTVNSNRYKRYVALVSEVLPEVKWVSAVTTGDNSLIQVKISTIDPSLERDDLSFSLNECGTGIGQVLAILYVLVNSNEPRTIIIDEPQSFLYPRAAKKLIEILNRHDEHQYVISTHSSEILRVANPSTITSLEYSTDHQSIPKGLDSTNTAKLGEVLRELGVDLGDVLYADNILFVEGETEEIAFPKILGDANMNNLTLLRLANTGTVTSKKNANIVLDIYRKLSAAHALVPPCIGIILDSEVMLPAEIEKSKRLSNNLLTYLPRRCFENYLLDVEAIAAVLNDQGGFETSKITTADVNNWFAKQPQSGDAEWVEKTDAANLLSRLFQELSESRVYYQKTQHSIQLTEWLLDNKPDHLEPLRSFILDYISSRVQS